MATTTGRVRRRRPADERVGQLLDAAESVLLERGLATTTIADVAEAAGVAKGTVYLYFGSKDALLAGLRARHLGRFVEAATERGEHGVAGHDDGLTGGVARRPASPLVARQCRLGLVHSSELHERGKGPEVTAAFRLVALAPG